MAPPSSGDNFMDYSTGVYPNTSDQGMFKLQVDVSEELKTFENEILRGTVEKIDVETGKKAWVLIAPEEKPPVNELGVREIISRLKARVTKIAKLSCKTDEEIYKDMFYFDMSISELIAKRCDKWDMDIEIAKNIKDACIELVWDVLASSRDGFTAINLKSQYSRQEVSRIDNSEGQKRSFLGIPLGRKSS